MSGHRLTIVARDKRKPQMDWSTSVSPQLSLAFVDSVRALRFALSAAVTETELDISRVIVDRVAGGDEFLDLLTALPGEFHGDVLFVRDDGTGVLSATGRGGDRVLYALMAHDVRFYLETHDLVLSRVCMELTA
ncbi:MAG TPA: hypothetical protein VF266_03155 [Thermoanaerobaculia bacterium]